MYCVYWRQTFGSCFSGTLTVKKTTHFLNQPLSIQQLIVSRQNRLDVWSKKQLGSKKMPGYNLELGSNNERTYVERNFYVCIIVPRCIEK